MTRILILLSLVACEAPTASIRVMPPPGTTHLELIILSGECPSDLGAADVPCDRQLHRESINTDGTFTLEVQPISGQHAVMAIAFTGTGCEVHYACQPMNEPGPVVLRAFAAELDCGGAHTCSDDRRCEPITNCDDAGVPGTDAEPPRPDEDAGPEIDAGSSGMDADTPLDECDCPEGSAYQCDRTADGDVCFQTGFEDALNERSLLFAWSPMPYMYDEPPVSAEEFFQDLGGSMAEVPLHVWRCSRDGEPCDNAGVAVGVILDEMGDPTPYIYVDMRDRMVAGDVPELFDTDLRLGRFLYGPVDGADGSSIGIVSEINL